MGIPERGQEGDGVEACGERLALGLTKGHPSKGARGGGGSSGVWR